MRQQIPHVKFIILLFLLGLGTIDCQPSLKKVNIRSIYYGLELPDSLNYTFAQDKSDVFKIKTKSISLRYKIDYDLTGNIKKIVRFKSEGVISYQNGEILNDLSFLESTGFKTNHIWKSDLKSILLDKTNKIKFKIQEFQRSDTIFLIHHDQSNSITIFELF